MAPTGIINKNDIFIRPVDTAASCMSDGMDLVKFGGRKGGTDMVKALQNKVGEVKVRRPGTVRPASFYDEMASFF